MSWVLIIGFAGALQGSVIHHVYFYDEDACNMTKAKVEERWDAEAICAVVKS